jgi:hypothetical protein
MPTEEAQNQTVYCNNCGTANPPRSVVCCSCGHAHVRVIEVPPEAKRHIDVERWFWISIRILFGLFLCISRELPTSGTTLSAALVARMVASVAVPAGIAAILSGGNWSRFSRWFLGATLILPLVKLAASVVSRIHF